MKAALHLEASGDDASVNLLTSRQRQLLDLVALGHTNREIAVILKISVRTVEVHRFTLMRKLNVRNVAQLLQRALQLGFLSSRDMRSEPMSAESAKFGTSLVERKNKGRRDR